MNQTPQPKCHEQGPKRGRYGYLCSLPVGHTGDHEARAEDGTTLDRWPRFPSKRRAVIQ